MKLLLTSGGLSNKTIVNTLVDMAGLPLSKLKVAFIPTASNLDVAGRTYALQKKRQLKSQFGQVYAVDISKLSKSKWLSLLEEVDIIYVNGGNTTHLMEEINKSGLQEELTRLLKNRVYVGVSAGSYVVTPDIRFNSDNVTKVLSGLNFVDFGLQVHLNSPKFPLAKNEEVVRERVKGCPYRVYALDDDMAVKIVDDQVEVIGEGKYLIFDPEK